MEIALRWTSNDLETMPDDGKRYEIIDGELFVSKQPKWHHQYTCLRACRFLDEWSEQSGLGVTNQAPGVIFGDDDDVAPDVVWISNERLQTALGDDGKLYASPELMIEVLSPGTANERRDREAKLKLYSQRGALEYWIIDWRQRQVAVYRRENAALRLAATLFAEDVLRSPNLPGFSIIVKQLFMKKDPSVAE